MFERICAATGERGMLHIRLLSRLHCAILRARSHVRITAITAFIQIIDAKQKRKPSSLRCSFLIVRRDTGNSVERPVSVYLKAQRRLLMRHMRMGISMDIIMVACCFILRSPLLNDPPEKVLERG